MRPLTDHTPKPLLVAGGKPLIVWHIEKLAQAGMRELIINHAHLGQQIETVLGDGKKWGVQIKYSPENPALETAGGIAQALPLLGDAPFVVINGDIFCDYDFANLPTHAAHIEKNNLAAHLVLVNNPEHHPSGDFGLYDDHVTQTPPDLPLSGEEGHNPPLIRGARGVEAFTFSGIGVYQPTLFAKITRGSKAQLAPLLREQIVQNNISGEHHAGFWIDVGTPQRLQQLDDFLLKIN